MGTWMVFNGSRQIGNAMTIPVSKISRGQILSFKSDDYYNQNGFGLLEQKDNIRSFVQKTTLGGATAIITTQKIADIRTPYQHSFKVYGKNPMEVNQLVEILMYKFGMVDLELNLTDIKNH